MLIDGTHQLKFMSNEEFELVDTHCHIQSIGADGGERITREMWDKSGLTADEVVKNAAKAGVTRLICVGCDLADSRLAIDFVGKHDNCWASIGIHPHEAATAIADDHIIDFTPLAPSPKVIAIGECGLDYYYEHSPKADQIKVLRFQLELASETGLPVIFHVREAFDDFWPIFDDYKDIKGVLHSFTDNAENLKKALNRGLYIGVNGIVTFAKDPKQLEVYRSIPIERLLIETDAPFLTPTPDRGKINEPKQVKRIGEFLAELRGENPKDLATMTTRNACHLFGI